MVPNNIRVLVLNDDRMPLATINWRQAIKRLYGQDKENPAPEVVEYYDLWIRDSKQREHPVPAVIANTHHVRRNYNKVPFSRSNVFRRDDMRCAYCTKRFSPNELTMDHVVPRAMWRGVDSPTCWTNIVASCYPCNARKRDRTPEQAGMPLKKVVNDNIIVYKKPKQPSYIEMVLGVNIYTKIPQEWELWLAPILKNRDFNDKRSVPKKEEAY